MMRLLGRCLATAVLSMLLTPLAPPLVDATAPRVEPTRAVDEIVQLTSETTAELGS